MNNHMSDDVCSQGIRFCSERWVLPGEKQKLLVAQITDLRRFSYQNIPIDCDFGLCVQISILVRKHRFYTTPRVFSRLLVARWCLQAPAPPARVPCLSRARFLLLQSAYGFLHSSESHTVVGATSISLCYPKNSNKIGLSCELFYVTRDRRLVV
jgi:hypothetical protein